MKLTSLLCLVLVLACLEPAVALEPQRTFNDPAPISGGIFGTSVALDGNQALVGVGNDSTDSTFVGQAHLFDAASGNLSHTFSDPTPTDFDGFGASVALDGNQVLIGAPGDDTNGRNVGQAHLFDATTGSLLQTFNDPTLNAGDGSFTDGDAFGGSVAIDGGLVLIGASTDDTNGLTSGQAHLFDAATGNLLHTFNDPTPAPFDQFGASVALDRSFVLIGQYGDDTNGNNAGQAHLFDAATGNLLHTFNDPTPASGDAFGSSVSISGTHVLIGAPGDEINGAAHLFDAVTGNLLHTFNDPTPTFADIFGDSVALDGNYAIIGAAFDDTNDPNVGQAHLFDVVTGNLLHTLSDPSPADGDVFGRSAAIAGNHLLVAAPGAGTDGLSSGEVFLFDAAVPEPGSFLILVTGAAFLATLRRNF